jgi:hypothetical protein
MRIRLTNTIEKISDDPSSTISPPAIGPIRRRPKRSWDVEFERFEVEGQDVGNSRRSQIRAEPKTETHQ